MGRIDHALRRAGADYPQSRTSAGQVFVSPWSVSDALDSPSPPRGTTGPELLGESNATGFRGLCPLGSSLLTVASNPNGLLVEQFRRLAGTLHNAQMAGTAKVVMVTSAVPGDGKTMTAVNLALTLSESYGRRVLLIDADLHRPSLHSVSSIGEHRGLSEGLKSKTEQQLPVFQLTDKLTLLPGGQADPDPMSGLSSPRMRRILEEASARFDWVILDTPPMETADASLLRAMVDTVLLVVRAGKTPFPAVRRAIETLGRDRIFGIMFNGVAKADAFEYGSYYGPATAP